MIETTATPRRTFRMLQPRKDELRRRLAQAEAERERISAVLSAQRPAGQVFAAGLVAGMLLALLLSLLP